MNKLITNTTKSSRPKTKALLLGVLASVVANTSYLNTASAYDYDSADSLEQSDSFEYERESDGYESGERWHYGERPRRKRKMRPRFRNRVWDTKPTVLSPLSTETAQDDSLQIQEALNAASQERFGGVVQLTEGKYYVNNVDVPSNIRIEVHPDAVIAPFDPTIPPLFSIGRDVTNTATREQVTNVEITTMKRTRGRFTVDLSSVERNQRSVPFRVGYVKNFSFSNITIKDNFTVLPGIFFVPDNTTANGGVYNDDTNLVDRNETYGRTPEQGDVINVDATDIHTGYSTIQIFSGRNMYFKNISGDGGYTVRLETGNGPDNNNRAGPELGNIADIDVIDTYNSHGYAGVFLKPHNKANKNIRIHNVEAVDSAYAVVVDSGSEQPDNPIISRNVFTNSSITGTISLTDTGASEQARTGFFGTFFIRESERVAKQAADGSNSQENFVSDPSANDPTSRRWVFTNPIAPILMGSALTNGVVGVNRSGRYLIDIERAEILSYGLERTEKVLYRTDSTALNGTGCPSRLFTGGEHSFFAARRVCQR